MINNRLIITFTLLFISCNTTTTDYDDIDFSSIDKIINNDIENSLIPGAVVLIGNENEILYRNSYGVKNPETNELFENDDIFRIASMTKAITSFGVIKLWEKKLIDLDDPIEKYIPEFKYAEILDSYNEIDTTYTTRKRNKDITIRQLMTHTSGIGYDFIDIDPSIKAIYHKMKSSFMPYSVMCFSDENIKIGESIKNLSSVPLHHEPGEGYTYGIGLDILGYMIEIVSGKPLDIFFREEIFEPLEMKDTYFYIPNEKSERLVPVQTFNSALSYSNNLNKENSWMIFDDKRFNVNYPIEGSMSFFAGGCGLSSTVEDYYNFLSVFINDGRFKENQIIKKSTNDLIFKNQLGKKFKSSIGLVFGISSKEDENLGDYFKKEGIDGVLHWGGYWNTSFFADPHNKIIGIIYKQTQNTNENTTKKFNNEIYKILSEI